MPRIGEITIYRRHNEDCPDRDDRYAPRCGCALWFQYQFDGKQRQHSSRARTFTEAQRNATELRNKLEAGEPLEDNTGITVERATDEWLKVREQDGRNDDKPRAMVNRLREFCKNEVIVLLRHITTPKAMAFRLTLPYRTGDSSSLKVHWSVIGGFFSWAVGMGYIDKSPIPSARQNKQFKITFKKPEVQVPSAKDIKKALAAATGVVKLMMLVQRWSGCAMIDAINLRRNELPGNLIRRNRTKTGERYRIRIPQDVADALNELPNKTEYFFQGDGMSESWWKKQYTKTFRAAKVKMSSHLFRHYRITELLSNGARVEDVAAMVGTSPAEIRKTYHHWVKEYEDRLDEAQAKEFAKHGLDENGKKKD